MSFHTRPTPGVKQLFTLFALAFLLVGAAMVILARTVDAGAPLEAVGSDTSLTPTPTPTCCNAISGTITSYCDTSAYPYHYTFGLTNGCSMTVAGSGGLSFQVSPNSTGPWSSPFHADIFNRPIPPGYSEASGSLWTGPLPQGNNWWRYGLYLSGQCWVVNITSAPQPACVGGTVTVTPVTATRTPTRTVTATATTCTAAGTPGPWVSRANYPSSLSDLAIASDGTSIYGFAGRGPGRTSSAFKHNYSTDTWTVLPTMIAGPSADLDAEYGNNGKIYVIGGASFGTATRIYDIASNNWSLGAPVPQYVGWYGSAHWNGKIYVIGGENASPSTGVHVYDIATDTWSTRAPLPQALYRMATVAINGRIYVANGSTGSSATNTLFIYDINSNTWTTGAPSPLASSGPASTVIGGKLYMISGGSLDDGPHSVSSGTAQSSAEAAAYAPTEHTSTYLYDPVADSWSAGPSLNTDHYRGGAATINTPGGETALVVGGYTAGWSNRVEASTLPVVPCATMTSTRTPTRTATATTTTTLSATNTPGTPTRTHTSVPPTLTSTIVVPSNTVVPPSNTLVVPSHTPVPHTNTPVATATATISPPCTITFTDVPNGHTFYGSIRCLACRGIISGYTDGTFRPDNLVTRGQLAKIVSNAANFTEPPGTQIFQDVAPDHTFYEWINRLTDRGYMSGYSCGSPGEPCVNNRPYFRPFANATRAQTSKIVSNAARYNDPPAGQTFEDVPPTHPFYVEIQRLASRNIMGGYNCGGPSEPCVPPGNRPYFRPYNNVTRGQSAKIVANTFYPECQSSVQPEQRGP